MKKVGSDNSRMFSPGLLFLVASGVLYLIHSMVKRRQIKMNTINKIGKEIYLELLESGFSLYQARYITAQAAHETGNFESAIFKENNNLFGMKLPAIRKTFAVGENKGHAVYKSISDCIKDFQIYYNTLKYLSSYSELKNYVHALKRNRYFEANESEYLEGCEHFFKLYFG